MVILSIGWSWGNELSMQHPLCRAPTCYDQSARAASAADGAVAHVQAEVHVGAPRVHYSARIAGVASVSVDEVVGVQPPERQCRLHGRHHVLVHVACTTVGWSSIGPVRCCQPDFYIWNHQAHRHG